MTKVNKVCVFYLKTNNCTNIMINDQNTNPRKIHVTAVFLSEFSQSIVVKSKTCVFHVIFMICQLFTVELLTLW